MNRGLSRTDIFRDHDDRQRFLTLISETSKLWNVEVYAYCLMGNHYHLLVQTPNGGLSRAMRHLDGVYTQRFNRAHRRDGPLFRGRYRAILIDAEEYLLAVARYIHRNPVGAGIVTHMDQYRWSSHYGYLNKRKAPKWLNTEAILSRFGRGRTGLMHYRSFMHGEVEKEIQEYYTKPYFKPILGGKVFAQWVMEKIGKSAVEMDEEQPESRRVFGWAAEEIVRATAKAYGRTVLELGVKRRGEPNEARAMAMYLCRALGGHKLTEIGKVVGLKKYSSVSTAYLRMKARLANERRLGQKAKEIENRLLKSQEQT
jgi:REP element-mobilizing transposase RayT